MTATNMPSSEKALRAGFKFGSSGPHISRTMMLDEISRCLDILPLAASRADYQAAIIEQNILGKGTEAARRESFRRLSELYALDPSVPLFQVYRVLNDTDPSARPLLSVMLACARDPLLRATIPVILITREGEPLGAENFDEALERAFPGRLKPTKRPTTATARNIASTWRQSRHLRGKMAKTRERVTAQPVALVMALIMGALQDVHGVALFGTAWCQMLDLNAAQARTLATQAHREGLLDLRAVGAVVEVTFPRFAETLNIGGLHESL